MKDRHSDGSDSDGSDSDGSDSDGSDSGGSDSGGNDTNLESSAFGTEASDQHAPPGAPDPETCGDERAAIARFHRGILGRRNVTLVIRAFVNEDGSHYGSVSDPTDSDAWHATFSEFNELINLVLARMGAAPPSVRDAYPDGPGPERGE